MSHDSEYLLILKSNQKKLLTVNFIAIIVGIVLLFYWLRQRSDFNLTAFYVMSAIVIVWMLADFLYWYFKGIREIRIMEDSFEIFRGKNLIKQIIQSNQITDIYYENRRSRRTFQILLGSKIKVIPGIFTYFPEPKIRITSDYFDNDSFDIACKLIEKMFKSNTHF